FGDGQAESGGAAEKAEFGHLALGFVVERRHWVIGRLSDRVIGAAERSEVGKTRTTKDTKEAQRRALVSESRGKPMKSQESAARGQEKANHNFSSTRKKTRREETAGSSRLKPFGMTREKGFYFQ